MNEYEKFKKVKLNTQTNSINFIDSLNKTKFEQLKEISQKTKIKANNKYQNRNSSLINTEFPQKKSHTKLKSYISNTNSDYSKYNKVPHKSKKISNFNLEFHNKTDIFPERTSDTQSHNNHIKKDYNNLFFDTDSNFQRTINNSNSLKKCLKDDGNKYMISKILRSKLQNKIGKANNEKPKPKIKIQINEKKISLIKNIQNNKLKKQEANNDNLIEKYLILRNEFKNNYNCNICDTSQILYIIDDEQNNIYKNINNNQKYSNKNDFDLILNNKNKKSIDKISFELLKLNERKWIDELDDISNFIINNREILDDNIYNKYIRQIIKINDHFNWLVNGIGKYFNYIFYENNAVNYNINNIALPKYENIWFKGFKWKGLFIRVVPQNKSKFIINEIKSLNYFFLDYIQIIDGYKYFQHNKNPLSNYIIFPLISYSEINGFVLYASTLINLDYNIIYDKSELTDIKNIIKENKGHIQLYSNLNNPTYYLNVNKNNEYFDLNYLYNGNKSFIRSMEKYYDVKDLSASKLFSEINKYHFIKIQKEKFLIFNVNEFIPLLFPMNINSIINLNMFFFAKDSKKELSTKYDLKSKRIFNNDVNKNQIIQNILKVRVNSSIKKKDLILCGIHFRILYETQNINNKNYKSKNFVDYLFNHEKINNKEKNNLNIFKYESYINEPYIILYDLIDPIKLKYSLINNRFYNFNNINKKYNKDSVELYYLNSNYISYFSTWCKMINNDTHIISYYGLKKKMKQYGIDSNLRHLILLNIKNKNIIDIIKLSFLVEAIKYIINKEEYENVFDNMNHKESSIFSSKSSLNNNTSFNEKRKEKILYIIQSILYPNEIISISKNFFEIFYQNLLFYTKVMFIKFKLIKDYLSLNEAFNINNIYPSSKVFLKDIIKCARKKPFIFIKELQYKLNFILNPYILFKSSLSIESMKDKLEKKYIYLNYINTYSYINNAEISGLALAKIIYISESLEKKINEKNFANKSIKIGDKFNTEMKDNLNYFNSFNYYDNESHNSTYDSRKNNFIDYNNVTLLSSKLNISDSLTQIPKIKEEYEILYENNFLSEIINDILKDFIVQLEPNCYKMNYNYENVEESTIISKNKNNFDYSIYRNLKSSYKINDVKIFYNWLEYNENIFSNILSFNGEIQHLLLKTFIFKFIFSFFIEKSIEKSKTILSNIKQIYNNAVGYIISLTDLGIINLLEGLINDKNNELSLQEKESFYSKSLILFLINYGDPRGRKNDSNEILFLPLWKIMDKIHEIERDSLIYDYFKEMFLALDWTMKKKSNKNSDNNRIEPNFLNYKHKKDNMLNIENKDILLLDSLNYGFKNKNNLKEKNNEMDNIQFLSQSNFKNFPISNQYFSFPLINLVESNNKNNSNINNEKIIFSKEFVLYLMEIIHNLLDNEKRIIIDEKYINENIVNDLIVQNFGINNIKENKSKESNKLGIFKKSSSQKGIRIIKTETKETKADNKIIHKNNSDKCIKRTNSGLYNNFSHFLYRELLQKLSYKLNTPSGVVISFGNNSHYETGLDQTDLVTTPHIIYKLKNKIIKHIYAGWEHNIIITKKGKVFSFGHNQCFQCGYPNIKGQESLKDPINISKNNKDIRAISASCGNEHSLILSNEHIVYSFGSSEDGILGVDLYSNFNNETKNNYSDKKKLNSYKLNKIDFGEYTNKIIEISSGTVHNLALTYDGKIFSWGSSQGGQLGLSLQELESYPGFKNNYFIQSPIPVPISKSTDINIVKISCGEAHSLALTNEGKVYSWGFGSNGQLGLGFCEDSFEPGEGLKNSMRYKPEKIESLEEEKICDIKCGKTFSIFVNNKGELFTCGVNDLYQLGIQDNPPKEHLFDKDEDTCYDFVNPTKVDYFLKMKVKNIACGEGHCLAVINDILSNTETIWSWGNNKFGQLGQNIFIKKCLPRPINCLFEYNLFKFDEVACGGFHSLALIKRHKNIDWIEDDYEKLICTLIDDIGIN